MTTKKGRPSRSRSINDLKPKAVTRKTAANVKGGSTGLTDSVSDLTLRPAQVNNPNLQIQQAMSGMSNSEALRSGGSKKLEPNKPPLTRTI